ncbi:MAG: helix-turn-helix domain-containing protein [Pseudomonadota bacterium]
MNMEASQKKTGIVTIKSGVSYEIPLSAHVRQAVEQYFFKLNGHPAAGLHDMVMGEVEKPLIETVLAHTGRNQTKASKVLGLSRSTLRKKMDQYGIE